MVVSRPSGRPGRLPRRALGLPLGVAASLGAALLLQTIPVGASMCPAAYATQLRQAEAAASVPDAVAQLQELAVQAGAAPALDPIITDLQDGQVSAARARLAALATALAPTTTTGCSSAYTPAAARALAGVYQSPAFAHLDQPAAPNWLQDVVNAIVGFLERVSSALGPVPAGLLGALVLGTLVALAAWRLGRMRASRQPDGTAPETAPPPADPEAEWTAGLAAADRGDYREAVRRTFRSALLTLALRGRLSFEPAWTTPELLAQAGRDSDLTRSLAPAASGFDAAWYSGAAVGRSEWDLARGRCQAIRDLARTRPDAGPHPPDAGPHPPDAGPHPPDAGPHPPDAGPHPPGLGPHPPEGAAP